MKILLLFVSFACCFLFCQEAQETSPIDNEQLFYLKFVKKVSNEDILQQIKTSGHKITLSMEDLVATFDEDFAKAVSLIPISKLTLVERIKKLEQENEEIRNKFEDENKQLKEKQKNIFEYIDEQKVVTVGNAHYIRFGDMQLCWETAEKLHAPESDLRSFNFNFPVPFIEKPTITTGIHSNHPGYCDAFGVYSYNLTEKSYEGKIIEFDKNGSPVHVKMSYMAIGKWK